MNFAIIAQAGMREVREWGRERNWHSLRLVSSEDTDFKTVLNYQDAEGKQRPGLIVFKLSPDGSVKHFYSCSAQMTAEIKPGGSISSPPPVIFSTPPPISSPNRTPNH